jgi:arylsulfatase A-like enzyme
LRITRRKFIGLSAGAAVAPWIARAEQAASSQPNIMLIVMDTTRADRCSVLGYQRETTPFLRALANEARLYPRCYSTSAWTVPSHASMFTGLYQAGHGAGVGHRGMSRESRTLAAILREHKYRTAGIIENAMLRKDQGFDNGFEKYIEAYRSPRQPGAMALDAVKTEITAENFGAQPFFCFVNLISPHTPYEPPPEVLEELYPEVKHARLGNSWRNWYVGPRPSDEHLRTLNALYDAELRYTDGIVRQIAEHLQQQGFWENTMFIIVGDHGENIGDHGHMDHVFCLYDTLARVPLLIRDPAHLPQGIDERPVQVNDLFATVLARAGIDPAAHPNHGTDLAGHLSPERRMLLEYAYPEQSLNLFGHRQHDPRLEPYRRAIRALIRGNHKYIWGSDGNHELYDLGADPGETRNLIASADAATVVAEMQADLKAAVQVYSTEAANPATDAAIDHKLDDVEREALEQLGYL